MDAIIINEIPPIYCYLIDVFSPMVQMYKKKLDIYVCVCVCVCV
jgi:hypothetical protein